MCLFAAEIAEFIEHIIGRSEIERRLYDGILIAH